MDKIKKGDIVKVISGKDRGKTGKVLRVFSQNQKAIVEKINFFKKHMRRTQENQKGGIIEKENPVSLSNLMILCRQCNKPVRVKIGTLKDKSKTRLCIKCNNTI
ncbi:MAG: 50S ribosomal protein L24 [Candidatus Omnitrophica bacterium]|nr:50S ribosomal protein L24 [Candidatus Omnitrophota bacterium]